METEVFEWGGLALSFLAVFLFSLLHIALSTSSKIALNRFLDEKEKNYRQRILDIYDELKISVEYIRALFLIAFLIYFFVIFPRLQYWPLWMFLIALAVFIIFFELIPRLISSSAKKEILMMLLPSYKIPYILARPLLWIDRIESKDKDMDTQHEASDEEIDVLIKEAKEEGIIEKEEGILLKSVMEFGDTTVREIMTPRVSMICIPKNATIERLRDLVIEEKHSRIPVFRDRIDNIEGIVIVKDLLEYSNDTHRGDSISSLVRPVFFIPESMKVAELLKEFQKRKQKIAIVVDEHGGVSGLVTMEDLIEEIVGEIQDEYDKDEVQFIRQNPFDYIVHGDAGVEDLEELFDLELATDNFITVGGLITHRMGRLPEVGEKIEIEDLDLEILEVDQKRIKKLRVKRKQKPSENE